MYADKFVAYSTVLSQGGHLIITRGHLVHGLFNGAVGSSDYIVSNHVMNKIGKQRKQASLRYNPGICLESVSKTENPGSGRSVSRMQARRITRWENLLVSRDNAG
jgi:hypothetical protein